MAVAKAVLTALSLLLGGEWRELYIRTLIALRIVDIQTAGPEELGLSAERSHPYSDSGRGDLQALLCTLGLKQNDAIVDLGCGKGGALISLADFPFSKITGVEISEELIEIAKINLNRLNINNVELVCCDAADFVDLDEYNYIYLYNPFPCSVLSVVINNIKKSLARIPRKITIIYLNPVCHELIVRENLFSKVDEFSHCHHVFYVYDN
jgi:SAM-dependent methyltransferase